MHGEQPDMRHAHRFGALVHYRDDSPANKLAPRTRQATFMGIPLDTSFGTGLLYTLDTGVLVESRDYSVFPDITPGAKLRKVTTENSANPVTDHDPATSSLLTRASWRQVRAAAAGTRRHSFPRTTRSQRRRYDEHGHASSHDASDVVKSSGRVESITTITLRRPLPRLWSMTLFMVALVAPFGLRTGFL
jgi:hypothetical protein